MNATFEARYRSACTACDEWILPGHKARYADDEVVHADCGQHASGAGWQNTTPCPSCFQVPSLNGTCGCEDLSPEWTLS